MRLAVRLVMVSVLLTACIDAGGSGDDPLPGEGEGGTNEGGMEGDASRSDGRVRDGAPFNPPPDCGDGTKAEREECDDGNLDDNDGCSAECTREPGFNCPAVAGPCAPVCGDGVLALGELCDDSNLEANDGCGSTCQVEEGWSCLGSGPGTCIATLCGDTLLAGAEACDDGNPNPGDGCSTTCTVEDGWVCTVAGAACTAARCGDGIRAGAEACDDGEAGGAPQSGDGCTMACDAVEPNFSCPITGGACSRTSICGDGILTSDEQCDDRDLENGDGCSATCITEVGWLCNNVGRPCTPVCGDSMVKGIETCDDGDASGGDGCDARCQVEPGWVCTGTTCRVTDCGDGITEGTEACDDGVVGVPANMRKPDKPYDGCYQCQKEPTCTNSGCTSACGDGIRFPDEQCDDGNKRGGDGCSATCTKETGFKCDDVTIATQSLELPIILRDFRGKDLGSRRSGAIAAGHEDFENRNNGNENSAVQDLLDADRKPVLRTPLRTSPATNFSTAQNFAQWYRDQPSGQPEYVRTVIDTLTLTKNGSSYVFDDTTFFPLDDKGFVATGDEIERTGNHNFSFTSELKYWFEYKGGEKLDFRGDDDVWFFVNGKLAVDLGGVHGAVDGTVTLNSANAATFGLEVGKIYEAVLFQAERHTTASSYKLTLTGFDRKRSQCVSICGDGVISGDEACDDGSTCSGGSAAGMMCSHPSPTIPDTNPVQCSGGTCTNGNNGAYGRCAAGCQSRGPHCGDGTTQADQGEVCDDGSQQNTGGYEGCTPDCKDGPKCGDGKVDGFYGEQCDMMSANGMDVYGGCTANCRFGQRCGDNIVQPDHEACDDGVNRSAYGGCGPGCKWAPRCGDGLVQVARGEQCDDGANNDGRYGGCTPECKKATRCGDNHVDTANGEECDDGNLNNFDGCSAQCQFQSGAI